MGSFTAGYTDSRGWRNGHTINSSSYATGLSLGGVSATMSYDGYGQLTVSNSSLNSRDWNWTYDLAGNRETEVDATGTTTYTPDALDRYSSITGQRQEPGIIYDADGNLTQDAIWTYAYDGENRLKTLTKSGQTLTFTYDYAGRRIRKTVTGTGAYDIKFLWVGWKLAAELASNGTTVNKTFVWGRDFSDAQGAAGGAGSLLAQISGGAVGYAIPDALGNIVAYANSSGTILASVEYSPYGKGLNATGAWQSYPIGFSGQYMDWEPGLVYYGLRYYAPKHGRFINRDTIEEAGGNNLYNFVGNAPTRRWDVLGLRWETVFVGYEDVEEWHSYYRFNIGEEVWELLIRRVPVYDYIWIDDDEGNQDLPGSPDTPVAPAGPGSDASSNGTSSGPVAPNNPERWSDEKCKELAGQIAAQQSSLNAFRNTHGGSYVDKPGLAGQKGAAEFARLYGGSASDYVSRGVGWAGVASIVAEVGARRFGGATAIRAVETGSTILSGVTHPTNLGLAGKDLNRGSGMSAAGNFAGAAGDITALILAGAQAAPGYGWALAGGSAVIFMAEQTALGLQKNQAILEIGAHYSNLANIEAGAVARIDANNQLYQTHCGGR